jgi:protein-ribulosamine 3-kinase
MKIRKKIFFYVGGAVIFITILLIIAFSYKEQPKEKNLKQHEKFSNQLIIPLTKPSKSKTFPIENIPDQREDINSQLTLEQRKKGQKLSPTEEKTIIESLASQVDIDKNKSFFDYKWGFGMCPAIRKIKEDYDEAHYLFTDKGKFFVKINPFSDLSRFEYEKESMLAINEAVPDSAPYPFCLGNLPKGGKFLVVNFIESHWDDHLTIESQKLLAKNLAQLHQKKSPNGKFGFHVGKNNQWKDSWEKFFLENRWQPLWKRIYEKYPQDTELKKWETIISEKVIPDLLGNLPVEPVLLHGTLDFDSWSVNSQTNQPWVFDPHSYYGHNEIDLSLFGSIFYPLEPDAVHEPEFLTEYQKYHALPPGFEARRDLYRLYHWLHKKVVYSEITGKSCRELLFKMKKLGSKIKTSKINVKIEKFLGWKFKTTKKRKWNYFKTQPFDYNSKTINKIKIESKEVHDDLMNFFEEEAEYVIEAEKMFVKNDKLKIPLLWQSQFIEGKIERQMKNKKQK